jgi:tRNA dimethylallyltransferase
MKPDDDLLARAVFLAGVTAVGKSELALRLAEQTGGEIISVDSMQVYRGMDIGTAKPSPTDRARVRHHLLDVAELTETFDAARFVQLAHLALAEISARGGVPIFCGGTGLYFKALLDGLGQAPPGDARLRAELEAMPLETLLAELARLDPECFAAIDRQNPRRVVRAVEVIRLTGRKFSEQRSHWNAGGTARAGRFFCLTRAAAGLHARIDARVDRMFADGLVKETRGLLGSGLEQNRTAMQALGYRQVCAHLRGEQDLKATIELVKTRTRQFAKRQMTWFRKHAAAEWLELGTDSDIESIRKRIARSCALRDG